jgi:hypothetical protein
LQELSGSFAAVVAPTTAPRLLSALIDEELLRRQDRLLGRGIKQAAFAIPT